MRKPISICPEVEEVEEENHEPIHDPHGENLRWVKRRRPEMESTTAERNRT